MKQLIFVLFALLFLAPNLNAQTNLLLTEDFETDGENSRYTSNSFDQCPNPDFFMRASNGTACGFAETLLNVQGGNFWASEDSDGGVIGTRNVTFTPSINIAGQSEIEVRVFIATSNDNGTRWDTLDQLEFQVDIDGAGFVTVGRLIGDAQFGGFFREDANLDGSADPGAPATDETFRQYVFDVTPLIPLDGGFNSLANTMSVRALLTQNGGSEELAFDHIQVFGDQPLPVELSTFRSTTNEGQVTLHWETLSETNNSGFEIETRLSGDEIFRNLAFVKGNGTTLETKSYSYFLGDVGPGSHEYRLRQIDFDGVTEYSPIIEIVNELASGYAIDRAYPNPFNPTTTFNLLVSVDQQLEVALYDLLGNRVRTIYSGFVDGQRWHQFSVRADALPSGTYIIQSKGVDFVDSQTVILLK